MWQLIGSCFVNWCRYKGLERGGGAGVGGRGIWVALHAEGVVFVGCNHADFICLVFIQHKESDCHVLGAHIVFLQRLQQHVDPRPHVPLRKHAVHSRWNGIVDQG